ncbi:MAG: glutathione S-transferase, partial [Gammaproteobacteria bacterium]|nr:glutathione S-transferase [Gammaproteobacteria bacterium]
VEDLSGLEPAEADWVGRDEVPKTLRALLVEVGRTYVPVMLANARAIDSGSVRVEAVVDGEPWVQRPFPYQAKCLQWVRQEYARLDGTDRAFVDGILGGTGCESLF